MATGFDGISVIVKLLGVWMDMERTELVSFEGTPGELLALAQLVKRLGRDDLRPLAVDRDEVEQMVAAARRLAQGLASAGYAPR